MAAAKFRGVHDQFDSTREMMRSFHYFLIRAGFFSHSTSFSPTTGMVGWSTLAAGRDFFYRTLGVQFQKVVQMVLGLIAKALAAQNGWGGEKQ